ncbi:Ba17 [Baboon cytomegalovirus]|nr:Ba17 [Baboon cytomegalovirus]
MTLHRAPRLRLVFYLFWIPLSGPVVRGATANSSVNSTEATQTNTTNASVRTTTLPPWPVQVQSQYSLWSDNTNCYCGALTASVGSTVTLNGTERSNETYTAWFFIHKWSDLLCAYWEDGSGDSMHRDYLRYNCTAEQITLLNLSTANSGVYYNRKGPSREIMNYTYMCYNVTVSENATNATDPPVITTTRCGPPPWKLMNYNYDLESITDNPTYAIISLEDMIKSRSNVRKGFVLEHTAMVMIQYSWFCGILFGAMLTILIVLRVPQKLCYLCLNAKPLIRGYKKLNGYDY